MLGRLGAGTGQQYVGTFSMFRLSGFLSLRVRFGLTAHAFLEVWRRRRELAGLGHFGISYSQWAFKLQMEHATYVGSMSHAELMQTLGGEIALLLLMRLLVSCVPDQGLNQ